MIKIAEQIILTMGPFYGTYILSEILSGAMRGTGNTFTPMVMTSVGVCVLRIVWVIVMEPLRRQVTTITASR